MTGGLGCRSCSARRTSARSKRAFPQINPVAMAAEPCMNSKTPDGDFVIGAPAAAPSLVLAGGFSGHGFTHAFAVGDIAVDGIALERFSPDRLGCGRDPGYVAGCSGLGVSSARVVSCLVAAATSIQAPRHLVRT
ncbi:FAD-dependent oxidoreductase [Kribbella sp. NPDC051587]|uniref:FAD-dependent oxidoreductase n=1 Tax=Kribbella sp. NPDC051587 TaxID=3364119 RepID=UPI0037B7BFA2